MDKEKAHDIVVRSCKFKKEINEAIDRFEVEYNLDRFIQYDMALYIKEVCDTLDIKLIEIPLKTKEIGASFIELYKSKYILLNTNQPKNKMVFSFYHDVYHSLQQDGLGCETRSRRFITASKDEYQNDDEEIKANLFAASILMPEIKFNRMFEIFIKKYNIDETIFNLMRIFNSPMEATIIRLIETDIIDIKEYDREIEEILSLTEKDINERFIKYGLDRDSLKATLKDQSDMFLEELYAEGEKLIDKDIISRSKYLRILEDIGKKLEEIKLYKGDNTVE